MKNKFLFIFATMCLFFVHSYAQKKSISATINPEEILIGQQASIDVIVKSSQGDLVLFPTYKDTIVSGLEVLNNELPIDTTITGDHWVLSKKYIVTAFDSLDYRIPFIPVIVGIDTLKTESLTLIVREPQLTDSTLTYINNYKQGKIDSLNLPALGISDIKPVITPPLVLMDYIEYVAYPLIFILLAGILLILYIMYKRKKKKGYFFTPKVIIPADILALNSLDKLREKQLVQKGLVKEYHTEVSDILRAYVKDRFGIDATEMLTPEIIKVLGERMEQENKSSVVDVLRNILELADLVKFAKFQPLTDENDRSLSDSYKFIKDTKIVEENLEDKSISVNNIENKQKN